MVIQIERLYSHLRQSVSFSYYEQDFNLHVNDKIWGTWRYTCICIAALKFCISIVFSFSWELEWTEEKLKTTLMQNFGVTNKAHYGMLWYFLDWSIERFHSRGQHLCKFMGTKESFYTTKKFNSHRQEAHLHHLLKETSTWMGRDIIASPCLGKANDTIG